MCLVGGCIMASMLAQTAQCSSGNECPSDDKPKDDAVLLQRDFLTSRHLMARDPNASLPFQQQRPHHAWIGHPTWGFVHCPKAAGTSFLRQLIYPFGAPLLPEGDGLVDGEVCHAEMELQLKQHEVAPASQHYATLFREPRAHVYSQYLECIDSSVGKEILKANAERHISNDIFRDVTSWLTHFSAEMNTSFDGGCYNPVNMQARIFECSNGLRHGLSGKDRPLPIDVLYQHVERYKFVGIVERYQESVCLFAFLASGSLPKYCDCEDHAKWMTLPVMHEAHGVRGHDVQDLSEFDLKMIDALTEKDAMIWQAAVQRFISDIDDAEKETGTRILCDREIIPDYMAVSARRDHLL